MTLTVIDENERLFEFWGSVEEIDRDGEILRMEDLVPVMPIFMSRGGPITKVHSGEVIGQVVNYRFENKNNMKGILLTGRIFRNYAVDDEAWAAIKNANTPLGAKGSSWMGVVPKKYKDPETGAMRLGSPQISSWGLVYGFNKDGTPYYPRNVGATIQDVNWHAKAGEADGKLSIKSSDGTLQEFTVVKMSEQKAFATPEMERRAQRMFGRRYGDLDARQRNEIDNAKADSTEKPFADYSDFEDCVAKNKDKQNPEAYCSEIQRQVEGKAADGEASKEESNVTTETKKQDEAPAQGQEPSGGEFVTKKEFGEAMMALSEKIDKLAQAVQPSQPGPADERAKSMAKAAEDLAAKAVEKAMPAIVESIKKAGITERPDSTEKSDLGAPAIPYDQTTQAFVDLAAGRANMGKDGKITKVN